MDIVGLGTLAMDVLMQVDALPQEDGFCIIQKSTYLPGGSGANVIVQASRLGAKCAFIAKLGDDPMGIDFICDLKNEGVDVNSMMVQPGGTTLHTNIVVDPEGRKFIMVDMGDSFLSLSDDADLSVIDRAQVFYTDLFPHVPAIEALKRARARGLKTVFNMQAGLDTMQSTGMRIEDILGSLAYVDVFAPCRLGLFGLAGSEDIAECMRFIRQYFSGLLLLTLGAEGSVAYDAQGRR